MVKNTSISLGTNCDESIAHQLKSWQGELDTRPYAIT